MKIYGVAILSFSFLLGKFTGSLLGNLLNIDADLGGVGFSMVYLIFLTTFLKKRNLFKKETKRGIVFWGSMYIPIVIAMSATQNVKAAWDGGFIALLVGFFVVFIGYFLVPVISKIGNKKSSNFIK
ncbi:malonate transporter subunit MadL [Polaribacter tangerinus]|uniref:malonate transporter subunit MadL n=1 Tax=Polaribacter tangerinus TaxID=1920034 RepID=UPI000B4AE8E4|nr:malonate transporter subunit MadL [Polaribacter tangerinus]